MLDRVLPPHLVLLLTSGVYLVLTLFPWEQTCVRASGLPGGQACLDYRGWDTLPGTFSGIGILIVLCLSRLALWHFPGRRIAWIVIRDVAFAAAFLMAAALILISARLGNGGQPGSLEFAWAGYAEIAIMAVMLVSGVAAAMGDWQALIDRLPSPDRP